MKYSLVALSLASSFIKPLVTYNHGQNLGTNLHLWGFITREKQSGASSPPPPPSLQCSTRVHAISPEFQHCMGRGEDETHFETEDSAF